MATSLCALDPFSLCIQASSGTESLPREAVQSPLWIIKIQMGQSTANTVILSSALPDSLNRTTLGCAAPSRAADTAWYLVNTFA